MLNYEFGDGNYLVSATYGADSMALLDQMIKAGVSPVVCHVDYHLTEENEDDERSLACYCQQNNLRFEVCDARFVPQDGRDDEFEKWARDVRYAFFSEMYQKYGAAAIFLPHDQDDLIEGYLLRKKLGSSTGKYGRERIATYKGMIVVRPFLDYTREDLDEYCTVNNVPHSPAAHDFVISRLRSDIRREIVERLNEVERGQIIDEMNSREIDAIGFQKAVERAVSSRNYLDIRSIIALSEGDFAAAIIDFVGKYAKKRVKISEDLLKRLRAMCLSSKENDSLLIDGDIYFAKEYDRIYIDNDGMNLPYSYTLEKPSAFSCPAFDLDFSDGAEDRGIKLDDYPLTIRTVLPQDVAVFSGYLVPVKKMLLAAGISEDYMSIWPVFLNKRGSIVYVPRFNKNFEEYHSSKLVLHPQKK